MDSVPTIAESVQQHTVFDFLPAGIPAVQTGEDYYY